MDDSLNRAAGHLADAARFIREAQRASERGQTCESEEFVVAARKAAEEAAYELRDAK